MTEKPHPTPEEIQAALARHDELKLKFENASPADDIKDDIDLDEDYRKVVEIRMDRDNFYIKHIPSEMYQSWSAYTGPRALKNAIVSWVDARP